MVLAQELATKAASGFCWSRIAVMSETVRGGATRVAAASFATSAALTSLWPGGDGPTYEKLAAMAEAAPAFTAFIDPDDERFLRPGDIPARVRAFCAETGQPVPDDVPTLMRVILESLALRYRWVLEKLEELLGRREQRPTE